MPPRSTDVVGVSWDVFERWFAAAWRPGEHVALIGPTGTGKSTFAVRIMNARKYVIAIDPKGEDSTLTASGFRRIRSWPPPESVRRDIVDGKGARLVVGGGVRTPDDWVALQKTVGEVLDAVFAEGGWTCFTDELQIAAQMMRHGLAIQRNLVALRDKKASMVTAYQAPSWVPTASTRQATWMAVWPTRDEDVIKSLASKAGRPRAEMQGLLHELPEYHVAVIGLSPRDPIVITHVPKLDAA